MRAVSVAALRRNLSKYLKAVQAGEELVATLRGQPIARIIPVVDQDARLGALIRAGILRPRSRQLPKDFWRRPKPADPEGVVLETLISERAEGR